jgi:hypothetical protein
MTKSQEVTETILRILSDYPQAEHNELIDAAIQTAMHDSFDEGMKHNEMLFNPNTQAFERFTPDFQTYNNAEFEYPGFIF